MGKRERIKDFINSLNTNQFIEWMNNDYLDNQTHGKFCKIHEMIDDSYWNEYLKPLGCDIAWGVANGCQRNLFNKTDNYVQYDGIDCFFFTFEDKEDYLTNITNIDTIIDEIINSNIKIN